jgi:hypothetical protein
MSMGQPQRYKWHVGLSGGGYFRGDDAIGTTYLEFGVFKDVMHPATTGFGLALQGYFGTRGFEETDGGFRLKLDSPFLRFGAGLDYNIRDGEGDFILSFIHPFRRSGLFGHGTSLRFDWLPGRGNSFNIGVTVPLGQRHMGRTRARRDHVRLRRQKLDPVEIQNPHPSLAEALAHVRDSGHWINRLTSPNFDQDGGNNRKAVAEFIEHAAELKAHINETGPLFPDGRTFEAEIRVYHAELDRAFSVAASDVDLEPLQSTELGRTVSARAKETLLEEVILPYNRLLGLYKKKDTTLDFAVPARGVFIRMLQTSAAVPEARIKDVLYVFQELLAMVEEERAFSRREWDDSRFVWIPYHFALLPEQHDTQLELDAIVERAVEEEFTRGNRTWYVINEQFHIELARMIEETEDYHVLWIHDIRGHNANGDPDELSFKYMQQVYIAALTRAVRNYDATGKLPLFMIFLDQFYYESGKGRLWLTLLENPLEHKLKLPERFRYMEEAIETAQAELRAALASSRLLQAEASQYGRDWLRNRIKVHVNITNPADITYWSPQIIPIVGVPDNIIRDHRKIAFYDVTEEDPYKGRAIYTGMGLGEHYAGATWEDRAIMLQGPAVLSLKRAAHTLLLNQGFEEYEIPYPLQPQPKPPNYEELVEAGVVAIPGVPTHVTSRAMQIHNQTGYRPKPINALKATLYTLMPPGSIIKTPDSLWNHPLWAGLLVGNVLRGVRVFIIAPSLASAPSSGFPQMSRAQELFTRLVLLQQMFAKEFGRHGGMLKTGIYDPQVDVANLSKRRRAVYEGITQNAFLDELLDFHPSVDSLIRRTLPQLAAATQEPEYLVADVEVRQPKLHLKSQFFASRVAWEHVIGRPEWVELALEHGRAMDDQVQKRIAVNVIEQANRLNELAIPMLLGAYNALPPEQREHVIFYLVSGSQNMDYRGMTMDGEVAVVVSRYRSLVSFFDFVNLVALATWVDTLEELQSVLPSAPEWQREVGRVIKTML